jgi:hypothetical protein
MASDNTLELVGRIDEFMQLHEFMNDDDLDEAMSMVIKLISKPEVPSVLAVPLIVKLQAIAAKFSLMATIYTTIQKGPSGSPNAMKKNVYYTAADAINKIVDALKYSAKYNMV